MFEIFLIIKEFNTSYPNLVTWSVTVAIVLLGLVSQSLWLKEYFSEWKLNYFLKNVGLKSLHNVTIADGIDGKIFVEYLILMPNKILLLGVKKYRGLIFAAEKIDLWTQVIGNKSYKFENPLRQLENIISFLNSKIENTKIAEKVLFIKGSEFPKGKPENIITISDLKQWRENEANVEATQALLNDWSALSELASKNDSDKNNSILIEEVSALGLNKFSLMTTAATLSAWLAWRLM